MIVNKFFGSNAVLHKYSLRCSTFTPSFFGFGYALAYGILLGKPPIPLYSLQSPLVNVFFTPFS